MTSVLYANARAASQEKNLLGKDRLKRMTDGDADTAIKILSEAGFGVGEVSNIGFDALLDAETKKLVDFILSASPDEKITKFFLYPYDYRNAEAIIKAKFLKSKPIINQFGFYNVKDLKDKIFSDDYTSFPNYLQKALRDADVAFVNGEANGLFINSLFVKALYNDLFDLNIKEKHIQIILRAKVDFINISIALRTRDYSVAKKQFIHFGDISDAELKLICESDFSDIAEKFNFSSYKDAISIALSGLENSENLKEFERIADGYAATVMNKEKFVSVGILPFIRYCIYKFADIMNARIILVGYSVGLSKEEIFAKLRESYEG